MEEQELEVFLGWDWQERKRSPFEQSIYLERERRIEVKEAIEVLMSLYEALKLESAELQKSGNETDRFEFKVARSRTFDQVEKATDELKILEKANVMRRDAEDAPVRSGSRGVVGSLQALCPVHAARFAFSFGSALQEEEAIQSERATAMNTWYIGLSPSGPGPSRGP